MRIGEDSPSSQLPLAKRAESEKPHVGTTIVSNAGSLLGANRGDVGRIQRWSYQLAAEWTRAALGNPTRGWAFIA